MRATKFAVILLTFFALMGTANAALPTVIVFGDGNVYYPSATTTITFQVGDADAPPDVNISIYYVGVDTWTRTEITSASGTDGVNDRNSMNFCTNPISDTNQICSYTWPSLTTGLDANYYFDINIADNSTPDDLNAYSGSLWIDSNACDSALIVSASDVVTITKVCTGFGRDMNIGSEVIYWNKHRQAGCASNYDTYDDADKPTLVFGEYTLCWYTTDGLGNTEIVQSHVHKASGSAYDMALLAELALAALLLMSILGAVVLRKEEMNAWLMIGLTISAVIVVIAIVIFAAVL